MLWIGLGLDQNSEQSWNNALTSQSELLKGQTNCQDMFVPFCMTITSFTHRHVNYAVHRSESPSWEGKFGNMVSLQGNKITDVPLSEGVKKKYITAENDKMELRDLLVKIRYLSKQI